MAVSIRRAIEDTVIGGEMKITECLGPSAEKS